MVGYRPDQARQLSHTDFAAAGAVSGAVTRAVLQPFDVLKIRFQLQVEPLTKSESSKYWGIRQAIQTIWKEEGYTAFWKGHVPAQVLSVLYGTVQYAVFEVTTKFVWRTFPRQYTTEYRPFTHAICGAIAGSTAIFFVQPVDVMRTRFISQGKTKLYTSLLSGIRTIVKEDGVPGLYRGLTPALVLTATQMGFQFGFYSLLKNGWKYMFSISEDSPPGMIESLVCGSGSGFVSKLIVYPLDVIKKRLEVQGFEKAREEFGSVRIYSGLTNCFVTMFKEEGLLGLYKGLTPSLIKAALVAGLNFLVYEQVCEFFLWRDRKKKDI